MIHANCRTRFTADDFEFIVRVLGRSEKDAISLQQLLTDADSRDEILEHESLAGAIIDSVDSLQISTQLYFYVLCRRVLKNTAVSSRDAADYIAAMLDAYTHTSPAKGPISDWQPARYLSDVLLAMRDANPAEAFRLRTHLANSALFLAGMFAENIDKRSRRGAPDLTFYDDLGSASFKAAAEHRDAKRFELAEIFEELAAGFRDARGALNDLAGRLFHFESDNSLASS